MLSVTLASFSTVTSPCPLIPPSPLRVYLPLWKVTPLVTIISLMVMVFCWASSVKTTASPVTKAVGVVAGTEPPLTLKFWVL